MRHEARLDRVVKDDPANATERDHLMVAAGKGVASAIRALAGPGFPDGMGYLYGWAQELHGRSGVGMSGYNPLTYSTIADWARLKDVDIEPHEVDALLYLDAVMLHPGDREAD